VADEAGRSRCVHATEFMRDVRRPLRWVDAMVKTVMPKTKPTPFHLQAWVEHGKPRRPMSAAPVATKAWPWTRWIRFVPSLATRCEKKSCGLTSQG